MCPTIARSIIRPKKCQQTGYNRLVKIRWVPLDTSTRKPIVHDKSEQQKPRKKLSMINELFSTHKHANEIILMHY
jgi:hypothetical protein